MTSLLYDAGRNLVPYMSGITGSVARDYFAALGYHGPDVEMETTRLRWMHGLAIVHSPAFLAGGATPGRPRIPLPNSREALLASAALGRRVAALLDTQEPVPGVTAGLIPPGLRSIANVSRVGCGGADAPDLSLIAGWDRAEERTFSREERHALGPEAAALLGGKTRDVYLNAEAYWKNVPERVWTYTLGGSPILKNWLSCRERPHLGRPLTVEEARAFRAAARRLAALVLLEPELDVNHHAAVADTYDWPDRE